MEQMMDLNNSQDDEPCTQPLTDDEPDVAESQESFIDNSQVYGYLIPLKPKGPMIKLDKDRFGVGRSVKMDLPIVDKRLKNFDAFSKEHFFIIKNDDNILLEDKSSNGTYINGKKVGKGKRVTLSHNDEIGMAGAKVKHYLYMSTNKDYIKMYPLVLREKYAISRELGKGACGTVVLGIRHSDHKQVAIKIINKKRVTMMPNDVFSSALNEVELLKQIEHPCIIRMEDVVESENELYIVLELAEGGELFDKIIAKTKLQENEAKLYFYQIVSAIEYLHSKHIAHRDLKPENILLCSDDDENPIIKVTDLGLSKFVDLHTYLRTFCGTPQYLAPEVLFSRVRGDGTYGLKVDMWSLGVILYILLCGCPPFNPDRSDKSLVKQVTDGDYTFPPHYWSKISPEAIDLVKRLMTVNPAKRLSASEALLHPWIVSEPSIIEKATRLMETQKVRLSSSQCSLDGILSEFNDKKSNSSDMTNSISSNNSSIICNNGFKRPMNVNDDRCSKRMKPELK